MTGTLDLGGAMGATTDTGLGNLLEGVTAAGNAMAALDAADMQAEILRRQAEFARLGAAQSRLQGRADALDIQQKAAEKRAAARARFAAGGIATGSGTPLTVDEAVSDLAERELSLSRLIAAYRTTGQELQAASLDRQADQVRHGASTSALSLLTSSIGRGMQGGGISRPFIPESGAQAQRRRAADAAYAADAQAYLESLPGSPLIW